MTDKTTSFRITFMWRFVLLRMAGFYQEGKPEGEVMLERIAEYLEQSSLSVADFIEWDDKRIDETLRETAPPPTEQS